MEIIIPSYLIDGLVDHEKRVGCLADEDFVKSLLLDEVQEFLEGNVDQFFNVADNAIVSPINSNPLEREKNVKIERKV